MVKMVQLDDGNYVPEEFCTFTNPSTSASGKSEIDDCEMLCFDEERCTSCDNCVIQKIFNEYAMKWK